MSEDLCLILQKVCEVIFHFFTRKDCFYIEKIDSTMWQFSTKQDRWSVV